MSHLLRADSRIILPSCCCDADPDAVPTTANLCAEYKYVSTLRHSLSISCVPSLPLSPAAPNNRISGKNVKDMIYFYSDQLSQFTSVHNRDTTDRERGGDRYSRFMTIPLFVETKTTTTTKLKVRQARHSLKIYAIGKYLRLTSLEVVCYLLVIVTHPLPFSLSLSTLNGG